MAPVVLALRRSATRQEGLSGRCRACAIRPSSTGASTASAPPRHAFAHADAGRRSDNALMAIRMGAAYGQCRPRLFRGRLLRAGTISPMAVADLHYNMVKREVMAGDRHRPQPIVPPRRQALSRLLGPRARKHRLIFRHYLLRLGRRRRLPPAIRRVRLAGDA